MAAGVTIKHKRKAGAFDGGDLAAGEVGIDTTNDVLYFSTDGSTVRAVSPDSIAELQLQLAKAEFDILRLQDEGSNVPWFDDVYVDTAGIASGSGYTHDAASDWITNQQTVQDSFTLSAGTLAYANRSSINTFSNLTASGDRVRVQFDASSGGRDIDAAYIGTKAVSGNVWDVGSDITQLLFSGSGTASMGSDTLLWSDWADFTVDHTDVINVAVDEGTNGNSNYGNSITGSNYYHKLSTDDAANQAREAGYTTNSGRCKGITAIEVEGSAGSLTVTSTTYVAPSVANPDTMAFIAEFYQPDEDVTLGTNLKFELSRNAGTNYVEVGSFTTYKNGTYTITRGTADLSAYTGQNMIARITTAGTVPAVRMLGWKGFFSP